jgi:hypothetical protein
MINDILNTANLYADGLKRVEDRRAQWVEKHKELKEHLKEIADELNNKAIYKQGFFVDTLHAFNEEMNGTCKEMPSLTFRSGEMPMLVSFLSTMGEKKEYTEQGFRITFTPTITGEVMVLLYPHSSELNKTPPQFATMGIISDPGGFTMDMADEIINKGMEGAFYSSFTGVAEMPQDQPQEPVPPPHHNPIGFKRYETTEKVH